MCNLYSITKGQQAIRDLARAMGDNAGNMPPLPGVFPDDISSDRAHRARRRARAYDGALGHAFARLRPKGPHL
jgi:hypothetical protein